MNIKKPLTTKKDLTATDDDKKLEMIPICWNPDK